MNKCTIRLNAKSRITKTDIQNINITLLAIVGIMQASEIFFKTNWLVDAIKYLILVLSIAVLFLQYTERKVSIRSTVLIAGISSIIVYTCTRTQNFSFLLIYFFLITGKSMTIDNFIRRSLKVLIILGGGTYFYGLST